jgi:hypothetical protein
MTPPFLRGAIIENRPPPSAIRTHSRPDLDHPVHAQEKLGGWAIRLLTPYALFSDDSIPGAKAWKFASPLRPCTFSPPSTSGFTRS